MIVFDNVMTNSNAVTDPNLRMEQRDEGRLIILGLSFVTIEGSEQLKKEKEKGKGRDVT
jgi:hypothetical protein